MAKKHDFNFEGGDKLNKISASWFVSYAYYEHVDAEHKNWENVDTLQLRQSVYRNTREHHKIWLEQIADMNEKRLGTNKIALNPIETKRMAKEILERMNEN